MILGLLWMGVANAAVLLAARAALRRVETGRPALDLVLFLLLRFSFIMALVLAAGLGGFLTPAGLGLPCALLLGLLLLRGERFDAPWKAEIPRAYPRLAIGIAAFIAVRSLLQVWFYVPIEGDATCYHLPKVADWIRTGSFRVDLGTDPRAWFPAGFELVETWWALFLRHDALIEMAGLEFLLLASAAAWSLARWLGLTSPSALLAALAVASTPGLAVQSVFCMNDGPAAALVLAAAALIAGRAPFLLLVWVGGMAAGLKPTTAYAAPGLLLFWLLERKEAPGRVSSRAALPLLALLGLALGAFWYVRTWILKGSPVYPAGSPDLVDTIGGFPLQQLGPSLASLSTNLADLANQRIYDGRRPYHALLTYGAGWGPAIVACGLPALVAALRWNPRLRRLAAAFALSVVTVLALVLSDACSLRFILWFPALPALALACAVERSPRLYPPAMTALIVACLATTFSENYSLPTLIQQLRQDFSTGAKWTLPVQPDPSRVGVYGRYSLRAYLLQGPDFKTEVVSLRADSPERLTSEMTRLKISLLYAMGVSPKSREGRVLEESVRRGGLRKLATGVYALR
jgi:hypothetical protein